MVQFSSKDLLVLALWPATWEGVTTEGLWETPGQEVTGNKCFGDDNRRPGAGTPDLRASWL